MTLDNHCPSTGPEGERCILGPGHDGRVHRTLYGRMWVEPADNCPAQRTPEGERCTRDTGHTLPHRSARGNAWPVTARDGETQPRPDWASLAARVQTAADAVKALAGQLDRHLCGATHTPEDVTYVCSRLAGHSGGHLDDVQDEWWALPEREPRPVSRACNDRLGGYGYHCTEAPGHGGPHADRIFGLTWHTRHG